MPCQQYKKACPTAQWQEEVSEGVAALPRGGVTTGGLRSAQEQRQPRVQKRISVA